MIPHWWWTVLAVLLGLAVGSFLNVVIYRLPAGESIVSPPSRCPRCGNQIRNRHNVPVLGWLVLRGKCYDCGLPISPRYPVVELVTGLAFAGMGLTMCESSASSVRLRLLGSRLMRSRRSYRWTPSPIAHRREHWRSSALKRWTQKLPN